MMEYRTGNLWLDTSPEEPVPLSHFEEVVAVWNSGLHPVPGLRQLAFPQ